ncbi:MAG: sel1 repeat family protein [Alphaproteobacteria bacterium]|nr:sel1 repeat family protein [Alphaproteobacteria bacterium]
MRLVAVLILGLGLGFSLPAFADFKSADKAYKEGKVDAAFKEFLTLAEKGDDRAQYRVARMMFRGEGVLKDEKEAVRWLRRAAETNNQDAQMAMGHLYAKGQGVKKDMVFAFMWYAIAAKGGFQDAIRAREMVAKELTKAQLDEGARLSRDWKPKYLSAAPPTGK